ncbi:hypothetical protein IEQ34_019752 [Dendrobium chrysotoxum]|uniref:Uncharacterized protein n=1 Tax=Dendrobium chrysotoxum TaxID=161865 RepID=A0AAV7G9C3_DENCH|nr:hypothetical protein IEQ34_019752 [Dendrobium chrysotoxum]
MPRDWHERISEERDVQVPDGGSQWPARLRTGVWLRPKTTAIVPALAWTEVRRRNVRRARGEKEGEAMVGIELGGFEAGLLRRFLSGRDGTRVVMEEEDLWEENDGGWRIFNMNV